MARIFLGSGPFPIAQEAVSNLVFFAEPLLVNSLELTALLKRSKSLVDLSHKLFIAFCHGNTVFFGFHLRADQAAFITALGNIVSHNREVLNHSVNAAVLEFQESLCGISKSDHFAPGTFSALNIPVVPT